jgi:hypothetical protein
MKPLSDYLPDFSPRKSQELRIRELELAVAELRKNQLTPYERILLKKLEGL